MTTTKDGARRLGQASRRPALDWLWSFTKGRHTGSDERALIEAVEAEIAEHAHDDLEAENALRTAAEAKIAEMAAVLRSAARRLDANRNPQTLDAIDSVLASAGLPGWDGEEKGSVP